MAKNKSRAAMTEDLESRTEDNYNTRDGEKTFFGAFRKDTSFPQWTADKGEHEIDIIPYIAGNQDPKVEQGKFNYVCDYRAHRDVGPRELWFLCLEQYGQVCPICEHRNELRKNPPTGTRQIKEHDDVIKALRPKRRVIYNIVVYDKAEEEAKGIQVLEGSHYLLESNIQERAKLTKKKGGGLITYASPDADKGHSITFERTGEGTGTRYKNFDLHPRDYEISDDLLDQCITLDELLYMPTYEEISDAFWDKGSTDPEDKEGEDSERPQRQHTVDKEPEDADLRPRRGRAAKQEDVEEEEEPRRRKPKARQEEPEEEDNSPRHRRSAKQEDPEEKESKCPVPGGVYGKDADDYDECEDCELWNPCVKASVKAKSAPKDEDEEATERATKRGKRAPAMTVEDDPEEEEKQSPPARPKRVVPEDDGDDDPPARTRRAARKLVDDGDNDIPF